MNLRTRYKIFRLSCKNDKNNSKVLKRLQKFISKNLIKSENVYENELFFSEIRQKESLKTVYSCLESCEESLGELEIATDFILQAIKELDNVLGRHDNDQELGIIFKNFCIGK
jgi:tRNA U34 5-carboxymethylaminomethyl modifying GTPase MnmE/TrmE